MSINGGGRYSIESRVNAVAQAQAVVTIRLGTWLRSPTKETRHQLEEALIEVDDLIDRMLCPFKLTKENLHPR